MTHKMGLLAGTIPASTTADDVITYNGNTYNASATGEKWTRLTAKCTTTTWNASTTFTSSTNKPYKYSSTLYYIGKPADATIAMSATAGTQLYAWSVSGSATTVSTANTYKTFTIATPDYSNAYNKKVWEFSYSGTGQQWVAPMAGTYTMECWGANGGVCPQGASYATPGIGGYTKGNIALTTSNLNFYIYVGEEGKYTNKNPGTYNMGGWNGGGASGRHTQTHTGISGTAKNGYETGSGGGGSTDIRLKAHTRTSGYQSGWGGVKSTSTRIMVAGGGGGCGYVDDTNAYNREYGGCGGGLIGGGGRDTYPMTSDPTKYQYSQETSFSKGGTQTASVRNTAGPNTDTWKPIGGFGFASPEPPAIDYYGCGAGGGWYGSEKGGGNGGAGGSSYISGHPGCDAVYTEGENRSGSVVTYSDPAGDGVAPTVYHKGASSFTIYNGVQYRFISGTTVMLDGEGYPWTTASQTRTYQSQTAVSKTTGTPTTIPTKSSNHGFCRITYTP